MIASLSTEAIWAGAWVVTVIVTAYVIVKVVK